MPELPEVETIKRGLERKVIAKKITAVEIFDKKIVKNKNFANILIGQKILKIERRGKLLGFLLLNGDYLLVHLKMTGQLVYKEKTKNQKEKIIAGGHSLNKNDFGDRYQRVKIIFSDKSQLLFNDLRRFGYLKIVDKKEKERIWEKDFGIEPLTSNFTWLNFKKLFIKRKTNIKALLMNQKIISGLGNIYVDEACFCAGILPERKITNIKPEEIKKLFICIPKILAVAIKNRGTTFNSFVDDEGKKGDHINFLKVYGRAGEKCKKCKTLIKKIKHAGRGTHFCPNCQK